LAVRHETNKTKISSFLEKVRNSHTAVSRRHRRKKMMTASAVAETDYYTRDERESSTILPARKRALKPKAKVRAALAMEVSRCDLLVQVVGAKNIPLRVEIDEEQFTATGGMSPNKKNRRRGGRGRDRDPSAERGGEEGIYRHIFILKKNVCVYKCNYPHTYTYISK
jgi:hypothetical protein